ncbi:MAG: general secretion pathway protein GspK [Candidatus Omnitrophica bacterium]|nr:general secretion pathway protein GspK [Candidatus Omnitrophota bacterium]
MNQRRALILMTVLWALFFLSVAAVSLSFSTRVAVRLRGLGAEQTRMHLLAQEGLRRAMRALAEDQTPADTLQEEWAKDFSLQADGALLSYKIFDEERLININTAAPELLSNLRLLYPEVEPELLDQVVKARPYAVLRDVPAVVPIPAAVFFGNEPAGKAGWEQLLTVYSRGRINLNTAARTVLLLIPGMTEPAADTLIAKRAAAPFERNETLSEELSRVGIGAAQIVSLVKYGAVNASAFRVTVAARSQLKRVRADIEAVVQRRPQGLAVIFYKES